MSNDRTRLLGSAPIIPTVCQSAGEPGLVSVLIPTYNRAYILDKAIDSVLAQCYRPIEVIVVDDGSTDGTRELVESYGPEVRYIYQENGGLAAARNTGLQHARGEFIAFQDSDDIWLPSKLSAQVAVLQSSPEVALVYTDMKAVDPDGNLVSERHLADGYDVYKQIDADLYMSNIRPLGDVWANCPDHFKKTRVCSGDIFSAMFAGNLVHPPTVLLRRSAVAKAGGLDLTYNWTCEDYEFFWRVSQFGHGALIEMPGMLYRIDAPDQLTNPNLKLFIARGNVLALESRFESDPQKIKLPKHDVHTALARAYSWLGDMEIRSRDGSWTAGVSYLFKSLRYQPNQKDTLRLLAVSLLLPGHALKVTRKLKRRISTLGFARAAGIGCLVLQLADYLPDSVDLADLVNYAAVVINA